MPPGREVEYGCANYSLISQEWLKIDVKLLLSANRKSYMPRRLAQQRMTLIDPEWPFHSSRVISAVAELLVNERMLQMPLAFTVCSRRRMYYFCWPMTR